MKLKNKVALVTGGTSGIGKAIAERFKKEGAKVIVFSLHKHDYKGDFREVDVSREEQIKAEFKKIKKLDILVNNAGIFFMEDIEKVTKDKLDWIVDVNWKGAYLMCKHALPLLKKSKGNILNIASAAGVKPMAMCSAYCSTKAALIMLTKCIALAYAPAVRSNVILPGPIDTPLLREAFPAKVGWKAIEDMTPLKKVGDTEDVANIAVFLASKDADDVTGGTYEVDGGVSL